MTANPNTTVGQKTAALERPGTMYGGPTATNKFNRLRLNHAEVSEGIERLRGQQRDDSFHARQTVAVTLVKKMVKARIAENKG